MPRAIDQIIEYGFVNVATISYRDNHFSVSLSSDAKTITDVNYVIVSPTDEFLYIGETSRTISSRHQQYQRWFNDSRFSRKDSGTPVWHIWTEDIKSLGKVDVYACPAPSINGPFSKNQISLRHMLEQDMIEGFMPKWNTRGKKG